MTQPLHEENLSPCVKCNKIWKRKDTDKYVYHSSVGVVCVDHKGVKEWYNKLLNNLDFTH